MVVAKLGYAFGADQPSADFQLKSREISPKLHFNLSGQWTGLDILRFHGFGNNTTIPGPSSFYRVERRQTSVAVGLEVEPSAHVTFSAGPIFQVSKTDRDDGNTLLIDQGPDFYGIGTFEQLGVQGDFRIDTRNRSIAATEGVLISGGGSVFPSFFDVTDTYGEIHGEAATYLTAGPTLALRVGAKKVFGTYPFHDAAYLGGNTTLRGFAEQRFAGDATVYGNAEFRFRMSRLRIIFPGNIGLFALADIGRVFYDQDPPGADTWHTAFGGGLWFSLLGDLNTMSVAIASSDERTGVYVRTGFHF
jgi:outer membrane protein assembly factor BamA